MRNLKGYTYPVVALSLVACMVTGCSNQNSAIDAAKKDVTASGQPQEVVYTDNAGNTTLTMVSPPSPGSPTPTMVQTTVPAGAQATAGVPDWSGGAHPQARHAVRYKAPGVPVEGQVPVAPGTPPATTTAAVQPATGMTSTPAAATAFVPANITIPAGTGLAIRINQRIDVKHAHVGQRFTGDLAENVLRDGQVVLPRGTDVRGVLTRHTVAAISKAVQYWSFG